jgi:hypothetical protein
MFPDSQSALPLPPHPSVEHYKKIAKNLVKACRSGEPEAIRDWAHQWVETLVRLSGLSITPHLPVSVSEWIDEIERFARRKLMADAGDATCGLASAQFVIARAHGFKSWPKFSRHIEELARTSSAVSIFETAADAVVTGNVAKLKRLLRDHPELVHACSTREHGATLLHYISANGVEGYRQRTPANIVEITDLLLRAGAEVDATASVYGGDRTTLLLTATSVHPERAGVQEALLRTLIEHGASIDRQSILLDCFANGRIHAAEFLAAMGARVGLIEAAALGRLDEVKAAFAAESANHAADWKQAFLYACHFDRNEVVEFLTAEGIDLSAQDAQGQTGLHLAVIGGHLETVKLLLKHRPPLEAKNKYGGTVVGQALWSAAHDGDADVYIGIIEALLDAGAQLPEKYPPASSKVGEWLNQRAGGHRVI